MPAWLLKFAPYFVIAALVGAVLWFRADLASARADLKVADARVADVTDANKSLKTALDMAKQARADNDAIAAMVTAMTTANGGRETTVKLDIGKAMRDDPKAMAWGSTPVPDSVRQGLRARPD